jgi:hypothetical protein
LEKGRPRTVFGTVVEHVKEWKKAVEGRVEVENKATGFTGGRVEHVDNVKEE